MQRYYHDVASKVKQAGGNGAIEAYSNSQITAIVSNSSTTSFGHKQARMRGGNVAVGQYSGRRARPAGPRRRNIIRPGSFVVKYL